MSNPIRYHSTNRRLHPPVPPVTFAQALLRGQAPDGGLYLPDRLPTVDWRALRGCSYPEVAHAVLAPFVTPEMDPDALRALLVDAYDFDVPTETVNDRVTLARLDRGPTASFKDFAARAMARWMVHFHTGRQPLTVLVATSGDTGSAVGEAFRGLPGTRVVILFPDGEVSSVQRAQLERIGQNVQAVVIDGKFDDCQQLVKQAFSDPDLRGAGLTSANSINVGRVLPQTVYYFYLYLRVAVADEPVHFCVPSGNLGNSLGAELARRMGLPVGRIVVATNNNDALPAFLRSGTYQPVRPSRASLSNAMNVGNRSNLAPYFDLYGGTVDAAGTVHHPPDLAAMRRHLLGVAVTDEATVARLRLTYQTTGLLVEPHGAVGLEAVAQLADALPGRTVCLETAHPAKFPEVIEEVLHLSPPLPAALAAVQQRPAHAHPLPNRYQDFRAWLQTHVAAGAAPAHG